MSRAAHVGYGAFAIESLRLGQAIVIGQSLGGRAALLLAAERSDLVAALVLADAGHDLHLDSPDAWRAAVSRFLDALAAG